MLPAEDGTWIYFDMVPEETEIREGAPEYTGRLCVIGSKLDEYALEELGSHKAYDKINVRFDAKPKRNTDIDCYRKETDTVH